MAVTSTIASKVNWRESPPTLNNELDPHPTPGSLAVSHNDPTWTPG